MSAHEPKESPPGLRLESEGPDQVVLSWPADLALDVEQLSRSELEVLIAILRGDSDQEIAAGRGTSARTIAAQTQAIYRKLGVSGRRAVRALFGGGD